MTEGEREVAMAAVAAETGVRLAAVGSTVYLGRRMLREARE